LTQAAQQQAVRAEKDANRQDQTPNAPRAMNEWGKVNGSNGGFHGENHKKKTTD
jgi:hypothetical protein